MFNTTIVGSDPFLEMPSSTQALYFHLGMYADDEGFVYPKSIMRSIGAAEDDLKILITKKFILPFESGVIVLKHWHVNNSIRYDRRLQTTHNQEKSILTLDKSGVYSKVDNQHAALIPQQGRISKEVSKEVKGSKDQNSNAPINDVSAHFEKGRDILRGRLKTKHGE